MIITTLGAKYCTPEINTSEIIVDVQWHVPMEFRNSNSNSNNSNNNTNNHNSNSNSNVRDTMF